MAEMICFLVGDALSSDPICGGALIVCTDALLNAEKYLLQQAICRFLAGVFRRSFRFVILIII